MQPVTPGLACRRRQVGVARLQTWNPTRYGALNVNDSGAITGDALSYDIFSQAGQAIKHPVGVDPLGGLKVRHMIAIGESQSASRLATYVNSIDPLADVYDGFVLLSTLGNQFRTDLTVPVWKILTEFDVENSEATVRQPDTAKFRTWEVAGTSHVDQHLRRSREPLELRDFSTPKWQARPRQFSRRNAPFPRSAPVFRPIMSSGRPTI